MANPEHLDLLRQGVEIWNAWRAKEPSVRPDLRGAYLREADLHRADLNGADLYQAKLGEAHLRGADLRGASLGWADLREADLHRANLGGASLFRANLIGANLSEAKLGEAHLRGADLRGASLGWADLREADLHGANLGGASLFRADLRGASLGWALLVETNLVGATLTDCRIYGVSAWNVKLDERTKQQGLIITPEGEPTVTVDDLEVAQFVYMLLHNEKIRRVIDTITSKVVLILGRFSPERKMILDGLRDELRKRNYAPVVFDFEKPSSRTTDETITLLARMARFVIADISDAKSVLQELRGIVPDNPTLPVQAIIVSAQQEPGMFDFFTRYPWFLKVHHYADQAQLLAHLDDRVIDPVEAEVAKRR